MPPSSIAIRNTLKDTDESSVHDRVLIDYTSGPWNPQTFYPGESSTRQLKSQQDIYLENPPKTGYNGYPSSANVYFWINDAKLNSYSPAQYGVSISLSVDQQFHMNDFAPGTVFPVGGIGKRFIAANSDGTLGIYNVKTVTVVNNTNDQLPFFVNYLLPQPFPISLNDFPASNSTGSMVKGGKMTFYLYNAIGPPNCGIYFYANGAAPTDPAIAATAISLVDSGVQNVNSEYSKVTNTNSIFTVTSTGTPPTNPNTPPTTSGGDTPPTSTDTSSNDSSSVSPSKHIWIWVGVAIGIIALIVVIAVCMHSSHKKSTTNY